MVKEEESTAMVVTFHGQVSTTRDAVLLFEAVLLGLLPLATTRTKTRQDVKSGECFVFKEARGMKRWTDPLDWTPSKSQGEFFIYNELIENNTGRPRSRKEKCMESAIKIGGMVKKTISVSTHQGDVYHLISYFREFDLSVLPKVESFPSLRMLKPRVFVMKRKSVRRKTLEYAVESPTQSSSSMSSLLTITGTDSLFIPSHSYTSIYTAVDENHSLQQLLEFGQHPPQPAPQFFQETFLESDDLVFRPFARGDVTLTEQPAQWDYSGVYRT
ncbi:hypothetical protein HDV03_000713 [Kappamyces sp. JEL0829]|nr:hypothetical protein HDV03_000713 [Kappamyces sp. JEL0829]KAJ3340813.1 hypothetical protein HDU91_000802 [Kappamyces sp. JEL0680]